MQFKHTPHRARLLWIEALRSGKYQQGRGALCKIVDGVQRHCCLGVACELFSELETSLSVSQHESFNGVGPEENSAFDGMISFPPQDVYRWLDLEVLRSDMPKPSHPALTDCALSKLNDQDGATFDEIANYIESKGMLLSE